MKYEAVDGKLVGGLEHFLCSHILGMSSSQLTNSYFSEGWPNHQPGKKGELYAMGLLGWTELWLSHWFFRHQIIVISAHVQLTIIPVFQMFNVFGYLVVHPTNRKWVSSPWWFQWDFCGGKSSTNITGVRTNPLTKWDEPTSNFEGTNIYFREEKRWIPVVSPIFFMIIISLGFRLG